MPTAVERFWNKVDRRDDEDCWLWQGYLNPDGYGSIYANGRGQNVHRFAYELMVGAIPDGLTIDHQCNVTHCVNPAHLKPATAVENVMRGNGWGASNARKTHCPRGHPFDEENTRIYRGARWCRACDRLRKRRTA